ncbi:MAG TPA: TolC family protein [Candidatus Polarisedimenticolia bacterium]|jgi:outer membrane protein TolC|nr:TolC family protein [Candidatus Polarisedimenticolia bacterium]
MGIAFLLQALLWGQVGTAAESSISTTAEPAVLLREAEESSPAIRAAQARLEAARHAPSQAQAPPDPEVSLAYTNDGLSRFTLGESEFALLSLNWTQEIRSFGKRRAAGEVASRSAERAEKELERVRLEVLSAVKIAYVDLVRLDRTAAILNETRSVLESTEEAARRRYEIGQGIQESVLKAQTEILKLEAESTRLSQERREVEARLNAAVGRTGGVSIGPALMALTGEIPPDIESLATAAISGSPEIGALEAEVRRGEAGAKLARLEQKPDLIWSASYQYRGELDPMVMGMFGVRLPLHKARKQAEALAQAESDLAAAQQDLADRKIRTESAVREIAARAQRAERLLTLYRQGIIPQAANTLESARASYTVGRIGFLDLFNDLRALLDARRDEAVLEAERIQALAALEPLVARELVRVPATSEKGRP